MYTDYENKDSHWKRFVLFPILLFIVIASFQIIYFKIKINQAKEASNNEIAVKLAPESRYLGLSMRLPVNKEISSLEEIKIFQIDTAQADELETSTFYEKKNGIKDPLETKKILLDVPFTPQAPFGEWSDPRQNYGCEEASWLMVWHYINSQTLTKAEAKQKIIDLSEWEKEQYGDFHDSSAKDTVIRFKEYFDYDKVRLQYDITIDDIRAELKLGNPVIVPVNGRVLDNPYFTPPGPPQHMLVVVGFDDETQEFITNDPGTKRGDQLRYAYDNLYSALRDYDTGHNEPITELRRPMIVIDRIN